MNPYDELGLRDEVIYLHSLWRQGPPPHPPPQQPPNPIHLSIRRTLHSAIPSSSSSSQPHYIPQPFRPHFHAHPRHLRPHQQLHHTIHPFAPSHTRSLPPVTSTAFKKKNKKKKNKKKETRPDPPPQCPGIEWPCPASPDPPGTGWPALKPHSDPPPPPPGVSSQEKERLSSLQAQNKACQAFKEFLVDSKDGDDSGGDDDDDDDDDGDNDDGDDDDDDGLEEFEEFFVGIFMEDNELRKYYQKCFESGEFCCLVCGAVEKKKSAKKFKDCAGLVQHSMSILRSANKRAHRAFGRAVCNVLGWDIDRLPTIVMKGEPLGCSVEMNPTEPEGEPEKLA